MMRRLRFTTVALVLDFAALMAIVVAPAAMADSGHGASAIQLSADDVHWSARLSRPLFDAAVLWVPGDSRTSSFFVKNLGSTPAQVSLQVRTNTADTLVRTGDVVFYARVAGGAWRPVVSPTGSARLDRLAIPVAAARRVDVKAVFLSASRNASQASGVVLRFVVRLGEALAASGTLSGSLPATGAPALRAPLLAALLLLGSGLLLVRRQTEAHDD